MIWLILLFSILFMVGAFVPLLPSKHESNIASIRQNAMSQGIKIQLTPSAPPYLPAAQKSIDYLRYYLPLDRPLTWADGLPVMWHLGQSAGDVKTQGDVDVLSWEHIGGNGRGNWLVEAGKEVFSQQMMSLLVQLPADICIVTLDKGFISIYWDEKSAGERIDKIVEFLKSVNNYVSSHSYLSK